MKANRINQLAAWKFMSNDDIQVKKYGDGYPYQTKSGILMNSTLAKPVYRYVKNYEVEGKKISLCMITLDPNIKEVEKWIDNRSKNVKLSDLNKPFTLLDVFYE